MDAFYRSRVTVWVVLQSELDGEAAEIVSVHQHEADARRARRSRAREHLDTLPVDLLDLETTWSLTDRDGDTVILTVTAEIVLKRGE